MSRLAKGCVAEFLGTFALIFFGAGSIVMTTSAPDSGANLATVAMAHGLVLIVFVSACMYISGAQFNPAVSIGVAVAGKQSWKQAGIFIAVQLFAAACGAGMLMFMVGREAADKTFLGATVGALSGVANEGGAEIVKLFILEAMMGFTLMFIIFSAVIDDRAHKLGGFCVGLTVMACIVGFGPMTGASMNPARSFGPALYYWSEFSSVHWVYFVAPVVGAIIAALLYKHVWDESSDS